MAISARKIKIWKQFFHKKKHYIVVVYVPSFYPSARPSSFFLAFFLHFYGKLFFETVFINGYIPNTLYLLKTFIFSAMTCSWNYEFPKSHESWYWAEKGISPNEWVGMLGNVHQSLLYAWKHQGCSWLKLPIFDISTSEHLLKLLYLILYTSRLFGSGNYIKLAISSVCGLKNSPYHPSTPQICQNSKNHLWSS